MAGFTYALTDGRLLGYAFYGPQGGQPVLYFHGTPSSRLEPLLLNVFGKNVEALLHQYNIRLLAIDRPGMGLSTFHEQGSFTSVVTDAQAMLQHLHIKKCAVLCWSGGGPYALSMAKHFPQTITGIYIIAGFSSSFEDLDVYGHMGMNKLYFNTARKAPLLLQGLLQVMKKIPVRMPVSQKRFEFSNVDYAFLQDAKKMHGLMEVTTKEACLQGAKGAVREAALYFTPFPYRLQDIYTPVHFWWGTEDNVVTYIHAKRMERNLPNAVLHYAKGEGHLSVYINCFEEVLQHIAAAK